MLTNSDKSLRSAAVNSRGLAEPASSVESIVGTESGSSGRNEAAIWAKKRLGSLSSSSNEYQAAFVVLFAASHAESRVVFPNPGGAVMMVTLPFVPACTRSSNLYRKMYPSVGRGGYSFVVRMGSGIQQEYINEHRFAHLRSGTVRGSVRSDCSRLYPPRLDVCRRSAPHFLP